MNKNTIMKYFMYEIEDDEVKSSKGEIAEVPADYIEYQNTFGIERIYYKINGTKITNVIGEGFSEETAKARVEDFISALNVNLY